MRDRENQNSEPIIGQINLPEKGFYSKVVEYQGIPIKSSDEVADEALFEAWQRLHMMLRSTPNILSNLVAHGAEVHIIGKEQNTSDLPENRHMKGKPFDGKMDIDKRTRGTGGLEASCGEENLLRLRNDRYYGRDICVHEFAHTIFTYGVDESTRSKVNDCFELARKNGLWPSCYALTSVYEYFSELCMWFFGTHGDSGKISPPPISGPLWLKSYDSKAFQLLDDLFAGRTKIKKAKLKLWEPISIELEPKLKSTSYSKSVIVQFVNQTENPLKLYWLDYDGNRIFKWFFEPLSSHTHRTFETHPFVVTDTDDNARVIFVAESYSGVAVIQTDDKVNS